MKIIAVSAVLVLGLCQLPVADAAQERSAWDKTRDGTVNAAKKTDRWMDDAVDKTTDASGTPRQKQSAPRPGPR